MERTVEPASCFEDRFVQMSVRNVEHRIQTACCATMSAELVARAPKRRGMPESRCEVRGKRGRS